ncbi:MAG: FumA C-terminus/TtdB family hydratase beta subunit [Candidatus Bathyarchaeia archaeon]
MNKSELKTPISEEDVRKLKVGDVVYVTGTIITARDAAHKRILQYLKEGKTLPVNFDGLPLFHCGPLVKKIGDEWIVLAAGPTTSMRMESFEDEIIKKLGIRLIIGKGGMGQRTQRAMREFGAAYGVFTGGAAVLAAKQIKKVKLVEWLDLGMPEALWMFEAEGFGPLIIAMDAEGNNLFETVKIEAAKNKNKIMKC